MSASEGEIEGIARQARRIRRLVLEMCAARGQGYAGQGLQLADLMASLYHHELRSRPDGRLLDRLVLSTGHSAIALYATLGTRGVYSREELLTYGASLSDIEESPLEGAPGFEITGGSLGQGLSQALGLALALRIRGGDERVYCVLSDGELQEGQVWEAMMAAAHLGVSNLTALIDNNREQADGATAEIMAVEPLEAKLTSFGLVAERVDGHDIAALLEALARARSSDTASAIVCDTIPGKGSPTLERKTKVHYLRLAPERWTRAIADIDSAP